MNIPLCRIASQLIGSKKNSDAATVVKHMGAMQAQDAAMCRWAVGSRMNNATDKLIAEALDKGSILRTHLMRPTWHLVAAQDIRWMLQLTAPQVKKAASHGDKRFELTDAIFAKCNKIIEKALEGGKQLTRSEIVEQLKQAKILAAEPGIYHILMRAEQDAVICNGAVRGKEATYALLNERVPATPMFVKEEALAMLASRYFTSHAPATLADFIWWSGLKTTDAKQGLNAVKNNFLIEKIDGQEYIFTANFVETKTPEVFFLPAFDEFIISYKNRADVIDATHHAKAISSNGIFKPVIVLNGKVIGTWKRTLKKDKAIIEQELFTKIKTSQQTLVEQAKQEYTKFLGLDL